KGGLLEQGIALGILQIDEGVLQELCVGPVVEEHLTSVALSPNTQQGLECCLIEETQDGAPFKQGARGFRQPLQQAFFEPLDASFFVQEWLLRTQAFGGTLGPRKRLIVDDG